MKLPRISTSFFIKQGGMKKKSPELLIATFIVHWCKKKKTNKHDNRDAFPIKFTMKVKHKSYRSQIFYFVLLRIKLF